MKEIQMNDNLKSQLLDGRQEIDFIDANGERIGSYIPADKYQRLLNAAAFAQCPQTEAELEVLRADKSGRSLREIFQHLESL